MIPWIVAWRVVVSMPQSKESRRFVSVEAVALPNLPQTFRVQSEGASARTGGTLWLCGVPHAATVAIGIYIVSYHHLAYTVYGFTATNTKTTFQGAFGTSTRVPALARYSMRGNARTTYYYVSTVQ